MYGEALAKCNPLQLPLAKGERKTQTCLYFDITPKKELEKMTLRNLFNRFGKKAAIRSLLFVAALLLTPLFAHAQATEITIPDLVKSINTVWVLLSGCLVFFMQLGFAYLEAGFVRKKNAGSIIMEGFIDTCITAILFWAVGYGLMFGTGNGFFGTQFFFMKGIPDEVSGIPTWAFMFFQFAFASAASTIVSGGLAERCRFGANLVYSIIVTLFIYPIVGHWIWGSDGWLAKAGFLDFAGSTVVHSVGGWTALAGLLIMGPRLGKYLPDGTVKPIKGHNLSFIALGTFVLWFGWFGFNAGSTLSAMDANLISKIIVNSNLSASMGAIIAMLISWKLMGKPDIITSLNGALAGLVAITAPCAFVSPESALIIGALAAPIMYFSTELLDRKKIDDGVGAIAVHGFCGAWGTLAVGVFHEKLGVVFGGGWNQVAIQLIGILSAAAFVIGAMVTVFYLIERVVGFRVAQEGEIEGLDKHRHNTNAYPERSAKPA